MFGRWFQLQDRHSYVGFSVGLSFDTASLNRIRELQAIYRGEVDVKSSGRRKILTAFPSNEFYQVKTALESPNGPGSYAPINFTGDKPPFLEPCSRWDGDDLWAIRTWLTPEPSYDEMVSGVLGALTPYDETMSGVLGKLDPSIKRSIQFYQEKGHGHSAERLITSNRIRSKWPRITISLGPYATQKSIFECIPNDRASWRFKAIGWNIEGVYSNKRTIPPGASPRAINFPFQGVTEPMD